MSVPAWEWMERGACQDTPTDWFFPGQGGDYTMAKQTCAGCPVRVQCAEWAIYNEGHGIWGGMSEKQRRDERRRRNRVSGRARRNGPTAATMARARQLLDEGWAQIPIARELGVSRHFVQQIAYGNREAS